MLAGHEETEADHEIPAMAKAHDRNDHADVHDSSNSFEPDPGVEDLTMRS